VKQAKKTGTTPLFFICF